MRAKPAMDAARTFPTSPVVPSKGVVPLRLSLVLVVFAAGAFLAPGTASAQTKLTATVGPAFSIQLSNESGGRVTQLDPGPTRSRSTTAPWSTTSTSRVPACRPDDGGRLRGHRDVDGDLRERHLPLRLRPARDDDARAVHASGPRPSPTPPPPPKRLTGTVEPELQHLACARRRAPSRGRSPAGTYRITIRDRSAAHNFHLIGPGREPAHERRVPRHASRGRCGSVRARTGSSATRTRAGHARLVPRALARVSRGRQGGTGRRPPSCVPRGPRRASRRIVAPTPPARTNPAASAPPAATGSRSRSLAPTSVASPSPSRRSSTARELLALGLDLAPDLLRRPAVRPRRHA